MEEKDKEDGVENIVEPIKLFEMRPVHQRQHKITTSNHASSHCHFAPS